MKKLIDVTAISLFLAIVAMVGALQRPLEANSQYGEKNLVIYKSTYTATADVAQHIVGANGGAILGSVIISSVGSSGSIIVYDSSNTTTSGREILANISANSVGQYRFDVEADLGLTYTTAGIGAVTVTYLDHR